MTQAVLDRELDQPIPRNVEPRAGKPLNNRRGLIWFALPSVIWYIIFTIGPLVAMFLIAFMKWGSIAQKPSFNGFNNFNNLWIHPAFGASVGNTIVLMVATIPFTMIVAFMIGYYLNLKPRGHRVLRVLMFAPALISISAISTMFIAVLGPTGLVNGFLESVGLGEFKAAFLADARFAMLSLILVSIWGSMGFNAILFAARLAAIDPDIYEAAELDGANHWTKMWRIAFPIAIDYFGVLTMLSYLGNLFGSAGLILLLTNGGPGTATSTLSWMVYRAAFLDNKIGFSQAIGVLLFVLGVVGLFAIRRVFRQRF